MVGEGRGRGQGSRPMKRFITEKATVRERPGELLIKNTEVGQNVEFYLSFFLQICVFHRPHSPARYKIKQRPYCIPD